MYVEYSPILINRPGLWCCNGNQSKHNFYIISWWYYPLFAVHLFFRLPSPSQNSLIVKAMVSMKNSMLLYRQGINRKVMFGPQSNKWYCSQKIARMYNELFRNANADLALLCLSYTQYTSKAVESTMVCEIYFHSCTLNQYSYWLICPTGMGSWRLSAVVVSWECRSVFLWWHDIT